MSKDVPDTHRLFPGRDEPDALTRARCAAEEIGQEAAAEDDETRFGTDDVGMSNASSIVFGGPITITRKQMEDLLEDMRLVDSARMDLVEALKKIAAMRKADDSSELQALETMVRNAARVLRKEVLKIPDSKAEERES